MNPLGELQVLQFASENVIGGDFLDVRVHVETEEDGHVSSRRHGWFALLYGGQEQSSKYRNMMIIGHLEDGDLEKVKEMPEKVTLRISMAE